MPKLYTMEEFIRRCIVVEGRAFVDEESRVLYLYRAVKDLDISALGFEREFLGFLKNSSFLFRFFEEMFAEQVSMDALHAADTYADFDDHLTLLEKIYDRYAAELRKERLIDRITIENYRLNEKFLAQFSRIDIHVDGYLSRFEISLLDRVETPLFLHFAATPFNRKLLERVDPEKRLESGMKYVVEWSTKKTLSQEPLPPFVPERVDVASFSERIDQAAFVLKSVERFVEEGADPDKIAVILPDESFAEYLKLFDTQKNFNYAMGTPFTQSRYYRGLADLYDALTSRSAAAEEKALRSGLLQRFEKVTGFATFMEFIEGLEISPREHEAIDESKFLFKRLAPLLEKESPLNILHSWLQRVQSLSLDDVGGGKITVMGVLESRGMSFDGVVIVDFNEDTVPKVGEKDLFLNSVIRRHADMPTRSDKESLQKNYYYLLMLKSERCAVCYVKNEEASASRFLKELKLPDPAVSDALYRPIIAPSHRVTPLFEEVPESVNPFRSDRRLTPTKLKDFLLCPRRFYYKYILNIRAPESEEKSMGSLIHAALEAAARSKSQISSKEEYFAFVMDRLYKSTQKQMQRLEVSIEWEERLKRFCELDFEEFSSAEQPIVEDWCEVGFADFRLSAKIDRVDVSDGSVRAIDYKTSKKIGKLLEEENDFQLLFYRLWAESVYPDKSVETLYIDLYGGETIAVDTSEDEERLKEVLAGLLSTEILKYGKTEDESACRYCDFRVACGRSR
ncbi:hypothetical protein NNO_0592 [Hydrogenimonas sp.]|nr:hypothetical protein NNO_0592 [Hydrogenimonas sp.]